MNTKTNTCVLRPVAGPHDVQYVPVSEVPFLQAGERVFTGTFQHQTENHGPSGSHRRTVCLPVGKLVEGTLEADLTTAKLPHDVSVMTCVARQVKPGDTQFRPLSDVDARTLVAGEPLFTGAFRTVEENNGPYGSHKMLVALPVAAVHRDTLVAA